MNRGESINVAQPDGWTPIMHAIAQNKEETVILLLKSGANLTAMASINENTAPVSVLEIAKHYGNPNIIHVIETAANKSLKDAP
jgi:ankyrin repeat protein